ncbi:MAG: threonyl-tRNA synthetase editing domain-containing protein [Candidatus Aminicenantes bacterium]|nr:threonyl-tRNA synthetase editing domain-containing protein [Candidatus Aminicenantes bacterium]
MKLLMIYCHNFGYKTSKKTLEEVADKSEEKKIENALVGFINMEAEDEENASKVETKLIKNLKWAANKNDSKTIVLHSFAHLSESKAEPGKTARLLNSAEERLKNSGYEVYQTPFGYFLDLEIDAPGHPLTRLFKSF